MPSLWGEGAPKGRMRGEAKEQLMRSKNTYNPLISQKSKIFASFPPGGSLCALRALSPQRGDTFSISNNNLSE